MKNKILVSSLLLLLACSIYADKVEKEISELFIAVFNKQFSSRLAKDLVAPHFDKFLRKRLPDDLKKTKNLTGKLFFFVLSEYLEVNKNRKNIGFKVYLLPKGYRQDMMRLKNSNLISVKARLFDTGIIERNYLVKVQMGLGIPIEKIIFISMWKKNNKFLIMPAQCVLGNESFADAAGHHYSFKQKRFYWDEKKQERFTDFLRKTKQIETKNEELFKASFEKCMNTEYPLKEGSYIYNTFNDQKLHNRSVCLIMKYMKKNSISQSKRQDIFNFLLKNMTPRTPEWMRTRAKFILTDFKDKKDYNEESRKIVKNLLQKDGCDRYALFLIDRADIYNDQEIIDFLKKKAAPYKLWSWKARTPWIALLILAQHGDKDAIAKIVKLANTPNHKERRYQIQLMPVQLAYVQQPEIVELLKKFLHSNESYFNGGDCVPMCADLSHASARALSNMIIGYPKINNLKYTKKMRKECIEWFDKHKKYKFNKNAKILFY